MSKPEVAAYMWEHRGRHACVDRAYAEQLMDDGEQVAPLIRLADYERLQAEKERLQADRAADKARIAELEAAIKDPETVFLNMKRGAIATPSVRLWSKLFGEVLNDDDARLIEIARLRERLAELETALRNIAAEVDGNIRECVRDCVNQRGNVQDIYDYCDRIDSTVDAALAQQGKEGEC